MEIGSSTSFPQQSQTASVNINETPRKAEEAGTVNNRVNSAQETPEVAAESNSTQAPQQSATTSGIDQQLRQSAVQSSAQSSEQAEQETSELAQSQSQSAINTFKAVEQFESGDTSAVASSAGLTAGGDGGQNGRISAVA